MRHATNSWRCARIFDRVSDRVWRYPRSPFHYPGGKSHGRKQILQYFPGDIERVVSPFLGGGSVELSLAAAGIEVVAYDLFDELVSAWHHFMSHPNELVDVALSFIPASRDDLKSMDDFARTGQMAPVTRAAVFVLMNRYCFGGMVHKSHLLMQDGRGRDIHLSISRALERLRSFSAANISVACSDWRSTLATHPEDFLYCDPPYLRPQRDFYGLNGELCAFEHKAFSEALRGRCGWLLSYNNHPQVRRLYAGYQIVEVEWSYGLTVSPRRQVTELLILG